jgi:hypothetical protein
LSTPQEESKGREFIDPDTLPETEELDDNLFDTSYLDAIASGEIQLAYIPESPTEEEGDDPFDTSAVADVVKRIEEAEKREKRQVNLGSAVDVLSGKAAPTLESRPRPKAGESSKKARARPRAVNLLGDFDSESGICVSSGSVASLPDSDAPKYLLDELLSSSPVKDVGLESPLLEKVDLLVKAGALSNETTENKGNEVNDSFKDILGEFDVILSASSVDDSVKTLPTTAILASILKPPTPEDDEFDAEFAALAAESIHKGPSPLPSSANEVEEEQEEEDPFDTTFVEKVAPPGKFELKLIECEVLGKNESSDLNDDDEFDFNPRVGECLAPGTVCPNPSPRSLLEDHSPSVEHPPALLPQQVKTTTGSALSANLIQTTPNELEIDPFDTSTVESILPGKQELKYLEEELLRAVEAHPKPKRPALPIILSAPVPPQPITVDDDDFDFDPRADEPKPEPPKSQTDILLEIGHTDHLPETLKVLTPQQEEKEVELDPFDTSIASSFILGPGHLQLKLLESEFVSSDPPTFPQQGSSFNQPFKRELSDPEFDPRGGEEPDPFIVSVNQPLKTEDIFDHSEDLPSAKPLIPQQEASIPVRTAEALAADFDDPFDTSSIEVSKLLPQSELKQIEGELLSAISAPLPTINPLTLPQVVPTVPVDQPSAQEIEAAAAVAAAPPAAPNFFDVEDPFELEIGHKPLIPAEVPVVSLYPTYADPFDTSIAEGFVPGKVEIRILEEELGVGKPVPDPLSDPDFNPRGPQPIHPSALSFVSRTLEPQRASDSQDLSDDIDPFDTSAADNLVPTNIPTGPGKSELKALEAELL